MTTFDELKEHFDKQVKAFELTTRSVSTIDGYRKAVLSNLIKYSNGDSNRKLVMKALTGKTSSKLLTDAEWYAFYKMTLPDPDNHWRSSHEIDLITWCGIILAHVVDVPEQERMPI